MKFKLIVILAFAMTGFVFGLSTGVLGYGFGVNGGLIFMCFGGLLGYVVVDLLQKKMNARKKAQSTSK